MTRRWVRRLAPLGAVLAAGLLLHAAEPPAPDLSEFHTVDNAVTTHVSKAAPNAAAAQPAYLGVNLDLGLKGAVVAQVEPDSPAGRAGLKAGDIIVALDGATIAGADDLVRALTGDKIARNVALDVLRGTERLTVAMTPQERKQESKRAA